jgi:hypothetical protein
MRLQTHVRIVDLEQRVTVCRRLLHGFDRDPAIAARPVIDDQRLVPRVIQLVADLAKHGVRPAARRIRNGDLHRSAGELLCRRGGKRDHRQDR